MSAGERLYQTLLLCYPAEFRHEYRREMGLLFRDRLREERRTAGLRGVAGLWWQVILDVLAGAPKEHCHMLWNDLRYALRMIRKAPLFTAVAILTLALGVGANTAIFSVVNGVLLRDLPFREPGRLVRLWERNAGRNIQFFSASVLNFVSWREEAKTLELAAFQGRNATLTPDGAPERVAAGAMSPNLPDLLGIQPLAGRVFRAEEEGPGHPVVLLTEALWKRRFGGEPGIVGQSIRVNDAQATVVGILPSRFVFAPAAELWTPLVINPAQEDRSNHVISVVGRLRPGRSIEQASAEMAEISQRLAQTYPKDNQGWDVRMAPFFDWIIPEQVQSSLQTLLVAVGLVALIACANVAGLLLARVAARRQEIAIRVALGAGAGRLIRQMLTESLLLGLLGGGAGLLAAAWALPGLRTLAGQNMPRAAEISLDGRVLLFALAVTALTTVFCGLLPAWQAIRSSRRAALSPGTRTSAGREHLWMRQALAGAQFAIATVLLTGALLLARSFYNLQGARLGFQPANVLTASVAYPPGPQGLEFYRRLEESLRNTPGVRSAAVASNVPFGRGAYTGFAVNAAVPRLTPAGQLIQVDWRIVSPGYFQTLGIPLLRGRVFSEQDVRDRKIVVILSQAAAKRLWGDEDPVGQQVRHESGRLFEVVGVVDDVRQNQLRGGLDSILYFAATQQLWPSMVIAVRTEGDPLAITPALRAKVRALDASRPIFNVGTLEQGIERSAAGPKLNATLLGLFAAVALALAAVGVYGVIASSVSSRTSEIGVRMALGARGADVLRMILRQGLRLGLAGTALGLLAAFATERLLTTLLVGVDPRDPLTFAGVPLILLAVVLLASYVPARRATQVDPSAALRCE
jgi:putative ABC transport system permease protein